MMYGYGPGWGWLMLMPLFWIVLVAVIVWAVVKLVRPGLLQRPGQRSVDEHRQEPPKETPQEILDRRFASGEIDADTYTEARAHLAGRGKSP